MSEKVRNRSKKIKPRRIFIPAAAVAAAAAAFVYMAAETDNDGRHASGDRTEIVTRMPLIKGGFFPDEPPASEIMLSGHDITIRIGEDDEDVGLNGVIYPITIKDRTLTYTSSNPLVAEVDEEGTIKAAAPGSTEITVSNAETGDNVKASVSVVQPVEGFFLQKSTINLYTTDMSTRLQSKVLPENASNTAVQWYSKDTNIVEVDQTGHLTPVNTGMTEVVARTVDGDLTGKCFVNVINEVIKAESVTIQNKTESEMKIGDTWLAAVSVLPANAKNKTVNWTSSNEAVAAVNQAGRVTAMGEGEAVITASSADGPSDTMNVKVAGAASADLDMSGPGAMPVGEGGVTYATYRMTLSDMAALQMTLSPPPKTFGTSESYASMEETEEYLDPNRYCADAYKYQFMDLSKPNGVSEEELNAFLADKGILRGHASAFITAAQTYGLSEIYLAAHACLETGNGTSQLATGTEVKGETVYNMYGIAAYDNSALVSGSNKAYNEGWTSVDAAIIGGAEWISTYYINAAEARQNTLYKMRWNPEDPGEHMYATDIAWAVKQAVIIGDIIERFPNAVLSYEIPVYAGSNAAVIEE